MFTLKFYANDGHRQRIEEAESLTILRDTDGAEITMHRKAGDDIRLDVTYREPATSDAPLTYEKVIIENSSGKTTEIIWADQAFYKAVPKSTNHAQGGHS